MSETRQALGDGVFVSLEPGQVVVTATDGATLALKPEVVRALRQWFRHYIDHERGEYDGAALPPPE